jgi:hypothetical protein
MWRRRLGVISVVVPLLATACAPKAVVFPRLVPPRDDRMLAVETVVLGDFQGVGTQGLGGSELRETLLGLLTGSRHFTVLANERELSGVTREARIGGNETAWEATEVLIQGRLSEYGYHEDVTRGDSYQDKAGAWHTPYTRKGAAAVAVAFTVIDVASREIIATTSIRRVAGDEARSVNKQPSAIDGRALLAKARLLAADEFYTLIAPHTVFESVTFMKVTSAPEMERAQVFLKNGEASRALPLFVAMSERTPDDLATVYNLGLAQALSGDYDSALETLQQAENLAASARHLERMTKARRRVETWHAQTQKLSEGPEGTE